MRLPHVILLFGAALVSTAGPVRAATPDAKLVFQQARDSAAANYKIARAQCDAVTGTQKDICIAQASAVRVRTEEQARARYEDTLQAYTRARMRIATANYDLDKARCNALAGNAKDVCQAEAKAGLVAAEADARADQKTIEARNEARDDKTAAEYKVALEKCDAFAGAAKDECVTAAKTAYAR